MRIIAVILAGGRSRRMGTPKALLQFKGRLLIDALSETLMELVPLIDGVVISGVLPGREVVPDNKPFSGPVEGIRSVAIKYLDRADAMLAVPVDLPLMEAEPLRSLILSFIELGGQAATFRDHPLPAIFRLNKHFIECCEQYASVKGLLNDLDTSTLEVSNPLFLTNTNTPEEWSNVTGANP